MFRPAQVALVAALVSYVTCAPQSAFKSPDAVESLELNPEAFPATWKQQQQSGEGGDVRKPVHVPVSLISEDSLDGDDTVRLTYANAEDTEDGSSISQLLPDSLRTAAGEEEEEEGEGTARADNDVDESFESGRKLSDLVPPDLAQVEGLAVPKMKEEAEIIDEIESILSKVREQYTKNGQSFSPSEGSGENLSSVQAEQSISDFLKLSTSHVNDEDVEEDPVIQEARKRYMDVWNQEADRLNATYMRVTKAWPELGMVYMPEVTKVTDQIKMSEAVKEAAATFKSVWEKRATDTDTANATVEPILKVLNNFMNAWLWAETTDEERAAGVVNEDDPNENQPQKKDKTGRSKEQKRVQDNSFFQNNLLSNIDSQLSKLYENIFNTRRPQTIFDSSVLPQFTDPISVPSVVPPSADPIKALGSDKITLSCSVIPQYEDVAADAPHAPADIPISGNIPISNPIADIRPIIDPLRMLDAIQRTPLRNTQQLSQRTTDQDHFRNPISVNRPFSNPTGMARPFVDPIGVNRASPVAYSQALLTHEADIRPGTYGEAPTPLARYNYEGSDADRHLHRRPISSEATAHALQSEEAYGRRYVSRQPWRQAPWLQ